MARTNATNFAGPLQFPYATAAADIFKKEDVQTLAQAVDQHDHSTGKGLVLAAGAIPANSITSSMIVDGTIDTTDLKDGSVTSAKIADGTIVAADIALLTITQAQLADGAITSAKILDGTIDTVDLKDGSVTSAKILDGSVTSAKIADGTILTADIGDNQITTNKILDGTILTYDLSSNCVTNRASAVGGTTNPVTTSASFVDLVDMLVSVTVDSTADVLVELSGPFSATASGIAITIGISLDGGSEVGLVFGYAPGSALPQVISSRWLFSAVGAGTHSIRGRWATASGTATANSIARSLTAVAFKH